MVYGTGLENRRRVMPSVGSNPTASVLFKILYVTDNTMTEQERLFLIGLRELTIRTGITIGGCGCCGSPYLDKIGDTECTVNDSDGYVLCPEVKWVSLNDKYDFDRYGTDIVK